MKKVFAFVVIMLIMVGCSNVSEQVMDEEIANFNLEKKAVEDVDVSEYEKNEQIDDFVWDLFEGMENQFNDANLVFSPYGFHTALSMAYEGAVGETREELREILRLTGDEEIDRKRQQFLYNVLNKSKGSYTVSSNNAVWTKIDLIEDYQNILWDVYGVNVADIGSMTSGEIVEQINKWVEYSTEGKITNFYDKNAYLEDIKVFLTNSIYFKDFWMSEFRKSSTEFKDFNINPDTVVQAELMYRFGWLMYAENEDFKMVKKRYDGDLSAYFILPNEFSFDGIGEFWNENKSEMEGYDVEMTLPKFNLNSGNISYNQILKDLGMKISNSELANFERMHTEESLEIMDVKQNVNFTLDEEGSEGVAVTVVEMGEEMSSGPMEEEEEPVIKYFEANRPFVFLIQHDQTDEILFVGKVMDPRN